MLRTADGCVEDAHVAILFVQAERALVGAAIVTHILTWGLLCGYWTQRVVHYEPITQTVGSRSISSSMACIDNVFMAVPGQPTTAYLAKGFPHHLLVGLLAIASGAGHHKPCRSCASDGCVDRSTILLTMRAHCCATQHNWTGSRGQSSAHSHANKQPCNKPAGRCEGRRTDVGHTRCRGLHGCTMVRCMPLNTVPHPRDEHTTSRVGSMVKCGYFEACTTITRATSILPAT